MDVPSVMAVRVDSEKNTVEFYFNGKKQAEYKVKDEKIGNMESIRAYVFVSGEGSSVEFIWMICEFI